MRTPLLLVLALAAPAAAQPVTQPSPCEVTISRAPDEVREAIEAWVNAEPRCSTTLDVRVVPTEGGLYIFARDGAGRIRERVVPDAQSAGVLVASWVADDLIAATPPPPPTPEPMPPSATPVIAASPPTAVAGVAAVAQPVRREGSWLTVGGIWQMHGYGSGGVRAELDVIHRGQWTLGGVLSASWSDPVLSDDFSSDYIKTMDLRLLATLARTTAFARRWELRLAAGAGVTSTHAVGQFAGVDVEARGVFPTAEASLMVSRTFGDRWALAFGPVATWCAQTYKMQDDYGAMITLSERDVEVMAFGALRRRL
jgi:hypothetical protein